MDPSLIHHDLLDVQMSDFSGFCLFWAISHQLLYDFFESSVIS
jgi:hypothetical protein